MINLEILEVGSCHRLHDFSSFFLSIIDSFLIEPAPESEDILPLRNTLLSVFWQAFMEDVKSRGPFIYSVLESAQAFLAQHPFQEPEETLTDGKGLLSSYSVPTAAPAKMSYSQSP